ncbi:MAG: EboA domain-containing protein [Polyangiales bacterium]
MTDPVSVDALRELIARAVPEPALRSFTESLERCRPHWPLPQFLAAFTATARVLGRLPLPAAEGVLRGADELPLAGITADVAGRLALLLTLAHAAPHKLEEGVNAAYDEGDALEKLAVVRSLSLLPEAQRFTRIALDAGRTNEVSLIRALACRNPFPARHYDELAWNKLYMKSAFVDLPLDEIIGLSQRANPELSRMALQYIEQQESAGRTFPPAMWLAVVAFPPPGAAGKLLGYLSHAVAEQRLGAARGLEQLAQARITSFVAERAGVETDERVRAVLARIIPTFSPTFSKE